MFSRPRPSRVEYLGAELCSAILIEDFSRFTKFCVLTSLHLKIDSHERLQGYETIAGRAIVHI